MASSACSATSEGPTASPPASASHDAFVRSEARRLVAESARVAAIESKELCKVRWLYYRGNENYGLGNVLYDVASAAALALVLNRTLVYGLNQNDRKFGTLLKWPGLLTMEDADALRLRARCGSGALSSARRVVLAPDKCTVHRVWRKERAGNLRCFRRLLGVNWVAERTPLLELSKVHAFTGLQTLLMSSHEDVRRRVAAFTGGCIRSGSRPNTHGAILSTLMRPVPAVLDAVQWALSQQQQQQKKVTGTHIVQPPLALHLRAMSDHRAKNASASEQARQLLNALQCVRRATWDLVAASTSAGGGGGGGAGGGGGSALSSLPIVVLSSSPELRQQLVRRMNARNKRANAGGAAFAASKREAPLLPIVFDWRQYLSQAPPHISESLSSAEASAQAFCAQVDANVTYRCDRESHLRDWGPEPHWVAVVELLLLASTTNLIVGAGSPYFKTCNTFTQIGAALADAAPEWLCDLSSSSSTTTTPTARCAATGPRGVRLLCASRLFSVDWGSSAWRTLNSTGRKGSDLVVDCGTQRCLQTPTHPDLWPALLGGHCPASGDTMPPSGRVFGAMIKPLHGHH